GGVGGQVVIAASSGQLFSSGRVEASGSTGGSIALSGNSIDLVADQVDASGDAGGGSIVVGGNPHGAGGLMEVSAGDLLTYGGQADASAEQRQLCGPQP